MSKIIIASTTNYIFNELKKKNSYFLKKCTLIKKNNDLNFKNINKIRPRLIFFPHWHWKIDKKIYNNFKCIGFHSTPLPYGRGGTPIQNMIMHGFTSTSVCAIKIVKNLDAGPIYLKRRVLLKGRAENIFKKINFIIAGLIIKFSKKIPQPKKQKGKPYYFKRRSPEMSKMPKVKNLRKIYNHIRMLDMEIKNFPKAFIKINKFTFEFTRPKMKKNIITAKVSIKKNND